MRALELSEINHLVFLDCLKCFYDAKYDLQQSQVPAERNLSYHLEGVHSKFNEALVGYERNQSHITECAKTLSHKLKLAHRFHDYAQSERSP